MEFSWDVHFEAYFDKEFEPVRGWVELSFFDTESSVVVPPPEAFLPFRDSIELQLLSEGECETVDCCNAPKSNA